MSAEILEIYPDNPDIRKIEKVIDVLNNDGLIIYPTDTVYSMGCDATNPRAVEKLLRLKNMKANQSKLSIVCADISELSTYARISNEAYRLIKRLLPGPYTIILPATGELPKTLQSKRKTIGIRVPNHKIPLSIIKILGRPIITTSVKNDMNDIIEYPNDIGDVFEQYQHKVDLIIESGYVGMIPSTVLDLTDTKDFKIIREGAGIIKDL